LVRAPTRLELTIAHCELLIAAIELWTAFTQLEKRPGAVTKGNSCNRGIKLELLNGSATLIDNSNR
jgi:hypothetical protein